MKPKQEAHLNRLRQTILKRVEEKYRRGAKQHGGDLFDVDCLEEVVDELIDGLVYVLTEIEKRNGKENKKM